MQGDILVQIHGSGTIFLSSWPYFWPDLRVASLWSHQNHTQARAWPSGPNTCLHCDPECLRCALARPSSQGSCRNHRVRHDVPFHMPRMCLSMNFPNVSTGLSPFSTPTRFAPRNVRVFRVGPLTNRTKAEDRMEPGIFVGFQMKSSEYILIVNGEAITARTV